MCTLIIGNDALGPGTVVVAANRDEDPARASAAPGVLNGSPLVVGGRDLVSGGTWLAIRERRAIVAMLNRREPEPVDPDAAVGRRSRGLLALDLAIAAGGGAAEALESALDLAHASTYAPFTLVYASPGACWLLVHDGAESIEARRVPRGWHALTHADLDDRAEPRCAWLIERLARFEPAGPAEAERGLIDLLRAHGDGTPPVCLHEGPIRTVSASLVLLARDRARYLHAEGRPCDHPAIDRSALLGGAVPPEETP
jgi:hypothetical protein